VAIVFGVTLLGFASHLLIVTRRAAHPNEDWLVVNGHAELRAGAGIAALWLGLGGGQVSGWCLFGFLVADLVFIEVMRRRHRV
jgi:hypothetical protein